MRFYAGSSILILEEMGEAGHIEIRVDCHIDDETWEYLKELAKKNRLGIKLTDHMLVICAHLNVEDGR